MTHITNGFNNKMILFFITFIMMIDSSVFATTKTLKAFNVRQYTFFNSIFNSVTSFIFKWKVFIVFSTLLISIFFPFFGRQISFLAFLVCIASIIVIGISLPLWAFAPLSCSFAGIGHNFCLISQIKQYCKEK